MEFVLKGSNGQDKIALDFIEVPPKNMEYDGFNLGCYITIVSGCFQLDGPLYWGVSYVLFRFANELEQCYKNLEGQATYKYEWDCDDFFFSVTMGSKGHAIVSGSFSGLYNTLSFSFETDQSYFPEALSQLKQIKTIFERKHKTVLN